MGPDDADEERTRKQKAIRILGRNLAFRLLLPTLPHHHHDHHQASGGRERLWVVFCFGRVWEVFFVAPQRVRGIEWIAVAPMQQPMMHTRLGCCEKCHHCP